MSSICQTCGSEVSGWRPKYHELDLYQCTECRSLAYRKSGVLDISSIYSDEYFHGGEYQDYIGHRSVHELNFLKRWAMLKPYLPASPRLFEIGCAHGFFVDFARRQGAEDVFGIDISRDAVEFARSQFGPFFEVASQTSRPPFSFNGLVAWDVWEHLEYPFDWFRQLVAGLEPGGIVALTTVDSGAIVARLRGKRWRQLHPPTHVQYPTRAGLAEGLKRLGLQVICHTHLGYYRALEAYLGPFGLDGWVRRFPRLRILPVLLDLRDIQFVLARKPDAALNPPSSVIATENLSLQISRSEERAGNITDVPTIGPK
jgi:SAM-dependent methyltransferase